jgi:hypothetical protein
MVSEVEIEKEVATTIGYLQRQNEKGLVGKSRGKRLRSWSMAGQLSNLSERKRNKVDEAEAY